ncbi:hypothetical protein G7Y89_g2341 [Cudoniella acicularis]|uniref:Uncharacterized protein n=1 Tax=Cudoniella acicularis TaxID=354080 RepID=A0A8H4RUP6_9HELO|nr:hypothetical protein G7Y89_g2341 [Cudoniella acicularis]
MSFTSVFPPSSTPGGWYGCFGPPTIVTPNVPIAWPVLGQVPCGNGTVESCCIIGDQCLSNGVCQILPVFTNDKGQQPLYYGAYCTDPTFSSPECAANCAVRYMAYCGSNNLWQCGDTDRTQPISCNLSATTNTASSTFFMIEPSKLAKGSVLPSTEPTTTESQYIPTQWGKPSAAATVLQNSSTSTTTAQTISLVTSSVAPAGTSTSSSSNSGSGDGLSGGTIAAAATVATILGVPLAAFGIFVAMYPDRARRGCGGFWRFIFCRQYAFESKGMEITENSSKTPRQFGLRRTKNFKRLKYSRNDILSRDLKRQYWVWDNIRALKEGRRFVGTSRTGVESRPPSLPVEHFKTAQPQIISNPHKD